MIHSNGLIVKTVATKNAYLLNFRIITIRKGSQEGPSSAYNPINRHHGDHKTESHRVTPVSPLETSLVGSTRTSDRARPGEPFIFLRLTPTVIRHRG